MLYTTIFLATFIIALLTGFVCTPRIVKLAKELHLYDQPNSRKVHVLPIPRLGGTAFVPSVLVAVGIVSVIISRLYPSLELWSTTTTQHFLAYIGGVVLLYITGLYDDVHGVDYRVKFAAQAVSAVLLCISGLWMATFNGIFGLERVEWWLGMPISIFFVVYVTNAMNLIDGIDGLASGLSSIALIVIFIISVLLGELVWGMLAIAFLGVVFSFFYYNVWSKENKIFMGDAGSLTLGYTLAFLIMHFWQTDASGFPTHGNTCIVVLSTLIIPMFDVVRVFMSRIRDHRNPFLPDKNHIHHKLLRTGLSAHWTMATLLLLSLLFIAVNYTMAMAMNQTLMLIVDVILFVAMHLVINLFIRKKMERDGEIKEWDRAL